MVLHFYFTVLDMLGLGLGSGLRFMCANLKQKYDGRIHLQKSTK
jgi:hypothetical protein